MARFHPFKLILTALLIAIGGHYVWLLLHTHRSSIETATVSTATSRAKYYCPMHPSVVSDKPDECPICGMNLDKMEDSKHEHTEAEEDRKTTTRKIIFYRHPMGKDVTSPTPTKDEMGMDYIPVYEDESNSNSSQSSIEGRAGLSMVEDIQQLIGVVKRKVIQEELIYDIRATGRIAYDPQIYGVIEEYRIAVKSASLTNGLRSKYFQDDSASLIGAAKTKLTLLGLSDAQITALANGEVNSRDYLLPKGKVWIYAEVFEYELPFIKVGQDVEVSVPSLPQETFSGKIASVNPVIDPSSRTVRIKTEVSDPKEILKPDMLVNTLISSDLGEHLVIPDSAVIHTGSKNLVFVVNEKGHFAPREITLGAKSNDKYAVQRGLVEGEIVVASANFLIDSESRIRDVVQKLTHFEAATTHPQHP